MRSDCLATEAGGGGSLVIEARVNDQGPFAFVLDTGSSGTTLDDRRIKLLHLIANAPFEQGQGMGGPTDVRIFQVGSIKAGPLHVRDIEVAGVSAPTLANRDIVGLAGVDLFGNKLAVWRPDRKCVQVMPSGSRPHGRGWQRIASQWLKPWKVLIPVRIGQARGWGLLDTGSQQTILSPGFADLSGVRDAKTSSVGGITGIDGRETALSSFVVPSAAIGRWRYGRISVNVAKLPLFERLGGQNAPLAIIGMDWIGRHRFAIDYGARSIWQALP